MHKKSVLIIDDDETISESLQGMLEALGLTVVCCVNGVDALDASCDRCFQVIVTDYQMPGMNGLDVTKRLRIRYPGSFIIGLSGEWIEEEFLAAGANAFFKKPFPFGELISMIDENTS